MPRLGLGRGSPVRPCPGAVPRPTGAAGSQRAAALQARLLPLSGLSTTAVQVPPSHASSGASALPSLGPGLFPLAVRPPSCALYSWHAGPRKGAGGPVASPGGARSASRQPLAPLLPRVPVSCFPVLWVVGNRVPSDKWPAGHFENWNEVAPEDQVTELPLRRGRRGTFRATQAFWKSQTLGGVPSPRGVLPEDRGKVSGLQVGGPFLLLEQGSPQSWGLPLSPKAARDSGLPVQCPYNSLHMALGPQP